MHTTDANSRTDAILGTEMVDVYIGRSKITLHRYFDDDEHYYHGDRAVKLGYTTITMHLLLIEMIDASDGIFRAVDAQLQQHIDSWLTSPCNKYDSPQLLRLHDHDYFLSVSVGAV
jgi:hypothetical protein